MKELIKVYLHLKSERVIDHGVGTMKLNANKTDLTLKLGTFKVKVTGKEHNGKNSSRSIYIWSVTELLTMVYIVGTMELNVNYTFDLES